MSDSARNRKAGQPRRPGVQNPEAPAPLYSHIRELSPRDDGVRVTSPDETLDQDRGLGGLFAQATKISMGTAFPALRSVARFLNLETYRTLPKLDKLPDLDEEIIEAELDDLLEPEEETPPAAGLLDWDEMEVDELRPSPYQLYLFDQRIEEYLKQTKAELAARLTRAR